MSRSNAALLLALGLAVPASPGCRSFQDNLLRRDVAQAAPRPEQPDPREVVRLVSLEHERRAELVQALKSELNVNVKTFTDDQGRDRRVPLGGVLGGTAEGYLRVERPRNLRVILNKTLSMPIADIGSNDEEFWFANDQSREIVVASHSHLGGLNDPLLTSMRADWIFEILGLESLPADVEIERGSSPEVLTLVETRALPGGGTTIKESVLSVSKQRIVEHRLYTGDRSRLVASARVEQPVAVSVGPTGGSEPPARVEIPSVVRLTIPDVAELEMRLSNIRPNPEPDPAWLASFVRPDKESLGYEQIPLFDLSGRPGDELLADSGASSSSALPPPPSIPGPVTAPGSLILPRADNALARADDRAASSDRAVRPASEPSTSGRVAVDLPSAPRVPTVEYRRSSWETVQGGNRFPRGVLGRD
ncbi:hypothetical protein [Tautonia sociabilis]|uniref:DUF4292 domain-containing protein n=1 Tax=Tautonia sociabilis TaxID=2080755 RepID=A0A432MIQ9_9BACT|nr:hypothetical protein [Tautonia sociabilis]RUL87117.1 hypothetical protein TsocGM_13625 [Tautonia sociabilis]